MTLQRLAQLEEQLEAEQAMVRRFSQYVQLAKDPELRKAFQNSRNRHEAQCAYLLRELQGEPHG